MDTISQREMRNNSAEILRRVAAGETLLITNNGRPAALLSPPPQADQYDQRVAAGIIRPAARPFDIRHLPPMSEGPVDSGAVLQELRGDR